MQTQKMFWSILLLSLAFSFHAFSQDVNVQNMIGKSKNEVIKKYGNPAHKDDSNPAMICLFYKTAVVNMVFVGNEDGIYQAEGTFSYNSESEARKNLDDIISNSLKKGFRVDTVSITAFQLYTPGKSVDLQITKNELSKKFDLIVKARKSA